MTRNAADEALLRKLLLTAYPDRVTLRRAADPTRGVMVGGRGVVLEPASVVRRAALYLSLDPRDVEAAGSREGESRVSQASAIEFDWLEELFPHLVTRRIEHRWDDERERIASVRQTLFAGLIVREDSVGAVADPEGAAEALFEALLERLERHPGKARELLAEWDEAAARWLARVRFLRAAMPELALPDPDGGLRDAALREACRGCAGLAQVRARGLRGALEASLDGRQRAALEREAPEALAVPSGSRLRLDYDPPGGGAPVLAARLQELFGWADTPRLAGGREPIVLHLLGPNHRPVQVTRDLRNFWNTTYAEVRRDLRARYPKHPWPEDPWNALPVAVGRRRRG